jgi:ABC-type amino acid transport substrate-binding protein
MKQYRNFFLFFIATCLFFLGSSCSRERKIVTIGIDPDWYKENVDKLQSNIFGFVEELLLLISEQTNYEFNRISVNWDALFSELEEGKLDACFSSIYLYNFNEDRFDFSNIFLDNSPVLVSREKNISFEKLSGDIIAIPNDYSSILLLEKNPDIILEKYDSVPIALNNVMNKVTRAVLVNNLTAKTYLKNIYQDKLYSSEPLVNTGIRLIAKKDEQKELINSFNIFLKKLKKDGEFQKLKEKWGLS